MILKSRAESSVADPHRVDADPDPTYYFDPNPDPTFQFDEDADPAPHKIIKSRILILPIPDPGSRIPDPKTETEERVEKI
jgi:hypothetical protein